MPSQPVLQRARTGLAVIGAAALLIGGIDVAAEGAKGVKPLLLGGKNKAAKTTKVSSKKGPALSLKAKKGPALAVNSTDLVKNLNADTVDGKDASTLVPTTTRYVVGAPHTVPGSYFFQITLQPGTYQLAFHGSFQETTPGGPGFSAICLVADPAVLTPPVQPELIYLADIAEETSAPTLTQDAGSFTFTQPATLDYGCQLTGDATFGSAWVFTVQPVPNYANGSGAPTVFIRQGGAAKMLRQLGY